MLKLGSRFAFLALASAIVSYQILVPPVVGLADNRDFAKVIGVFDLTGPVQDENTWANPHYDFNAWINARYEFNPKKGYWYDFYSSEHLIVAASVATNTVLSKDGYYDLRSIGLIHGALFLLALYLLRSLLDDAPRILRLATCGTALFVFTDVMYVSYLNSFYMDVAAWLFILIAAMLYLRLLRGGAGLDGLYFVVCCAMAITSKAQHGIFGFWLGPLVLAVCYPRWPKHRKWIMAAAASLMLLAVVWITKSAPPSYPSRAIFTMVFYRILPHSNNVDQTIRALGLDQSDRRYIGMHSFAEGSPMDDASYVERFRSRISYGGLAWFYLTHPRDAYRALRVSLNEAGTQRPNLGNFDVHTGYPPFHASRAFAFWSDLKRRAFNERGSRYLLTFIGLSGFVGILLAAQRRSLPTGSVVGGVVLVGMAFTAMFVASLADGVDVPRHHLLFYVLSDMLVVLTVHLSVRALLGSLGGHDVHKSVKFKMGNTPHPSAPV
jgi:hypothetical protein